MENRVKKILLMNIQIFKLKKSPKPDTLFQKNKKLIMVNKAYKNKYQSIFRVKN